MKTTEDAEDAEETTGEFFQMIREYYARTGALSISSLRVPCVLCGFHFRYSSAAPALQAFT